tara:strand:+ start:13601 stop:14311 length:711 start_codon:yes stop_codon:yes gene_type:complete
MIQTFTQSNFDAFIQTEDNRIQTPAAAGGTRYLFKFTNDMDGSVQYAYPDQIVENRYSKFSFTYNATPDVFLGRVNLSPAGYWKYEVFEVTWDFTITMNGSFAPSTEDFVFNPAGVKFGVVQGAVTKGKMYVGELRGTEEVSYIQKAKSVLTLTIVDGGSGYPSAPTLTITGGGFITQATATCTISGGVVNSVTLLNGGSGYTQNPTVSVSNPLPGATEGAQIIANINESNYIYTG